MWLYIPELNGNNGKKTNGRSSIRYATSSPTALGSEQFLIPPTLQLLRDSEIKQTKMRLNDNIGRAKRQVGGGKNTIKCPSK
jgi:hypothetical protein